MGRGQYILSHYIINCLYLLKRLVVTISIWSINYTHTVHAKQTYIHNIYIQYIPYIVYYSYQEQVKNVFKDDQGKLKEKEFIKIMDKLL